MSSRHFTLVQTSSSANSKYYFVAQYLEGITKVLIFRQIENLESEYQNILVKHKQIDSPSEQRRMSLVTRKRLTLFLFHKMATNLSILMHVHLNN